LKTTDKLKLILVIVLAVTLANVKFTLDSISVKNLQYFRIADFTGVASAILHKGVGIEISGKGGNGKNKAEK